MGNEVADNAIKAPDSVTADPQPATAPAPQADPAAASPEAQMPDFDAMSDEEVIKWDEQQGEGKEKAVEPAPEPEKAMEKPPEAGQQAAPDQGGDLESLKAELAVLKKETELINEYRKDPVGFFARNPEVASQLEQARRQHAAETAQAERPAWAYAAPGAVRLPNDPAWGQLAGLTVAQVKELADAGRLEDGVYDQVLHKVIADQGVARGQFEASQRVIIQQRQQQGSALWGSFQDHLKGANPQITPDQQRQMVDQLVSFMSNPDNMTPTSMYKLMNYDQDIKAAVERGRQAGLEEARKGLNQDLARASAAPVGGGTPNQGGAAPLSLVDQYLSMSANQRAAFIDRLSEAQVMELSKALDAREGYQG